MLFFFGPVSIAVDTDPLWFALVGKGIFGLSITARLDKADEGLFSLRMAAWSALNPVKTEILISILIHS